MFVHVHLFDLDNCDLSMSLIHSSTHTRFHTHVYTHTHTHTLSLSPTKKKESKPGALRRLPLALQTAAPSPAQSLHTHGVQSVPAARVLQPRTGTAQHSTNERRRSAHSDACRRTTGWFQHKSANGGVVGVGGEGAVFVVRKRS